MLNTTATNQLSQLGFGLRSPTLLRVRSGQISPTSIFNNPKSESSYYGDRARFGSDDGNFNNLEANF